MLKKRGKTWHCHFVVNGQRIRQSLETTDKREALAKEKDLIAQVQTGKLHQSSISRARKPFNKAADDYITALKLEPSKKTGEILASVSQAKENDLLVQLRVFFKEEPLKSITAERINEYRIWRSSQTREVKVGNEVQVRRRAGDATVKAELGTLRKILKRAKLWARIADDVRFPQEPESIGRALTADETQRLLRIAVMRPEWETAYLAAILCLNTTARGCELKGLRWEDVDLFGKVFTIRKSKTRAGKRTVPLTAVACSAFARLLSRAESFGQVEPSHYVFAAFTPKFGFNDTNVVSFTLSGFDPTRHIKSWRTAWRTLTRKAGFPGFRFHDLRHCAITSLAESGAADATIMGIAGHVSRKMLERYSHARMEAKRKAMEVLANATGDMGYDTKRDTKGLPVTPRPV
jgi:integrase